MADIKIFDGLALQQLGDFIVAVWNAPARVERARPMYDEVDRIMAANPAGVFWLQVVMEVSSTPDGPMRDENHTRLRKWRATLRRVATAPVGSAIWSTVVGTIMRGMFVVTGQSRTQLVASTEHEAIDLLLREATPRSPSRAQLVAAMDELYQALGVKRTCAGPIAR